MLDARSSDVSGVHVTVQPLTSEPTNGKWEFNVTMNTHTTPLTADLTKVSVLVDDTGRRIASATWQGDAPGGHHRKGILAFPFQGAKPKSIEVRIDGIGGSETRAFKWWLD
jgi:hypothetical protein